MLMKKIGIFVFGMMLVILAIVLVGCKNDGNKERTSGTHTQHTGEKEQDETIYCPSFMGQTIDSINQNAEYYSHFRFETVWEYNDEYEYSYVYKQSVSEGTEITKGTQITLYVSMGEDIRYEDVAKQYATAIVKSDYSNINEYLPYNSERMVEYADYDAYENGLDVTATVARSQIATEEQIIGLLNEISYEWNFYGFHVEDYIDLNKINKGYVVDVRLSVYEPADNERWGSETFTYTVINYDGTWKVLTDFITDRDEMYEKW